MGWGDKDRDRDEELTQTRGSWVQKEGGAGLSIPWLAHLLGHGVDESHIEVLLCPKS